MISRSKIRQHALQLLYSMREQQLDSSDFDFDSFWAIATEKDTARLVASQARAAIHLCRGMDDLVRLLHERAETALSLMEPYIETSSLRERLEKLLRATNNCSGALEQLRFTWKHRERRGNTELAEAISRVWQTFAVEAALAEGIVPLFADFPAYARVLEPLEAALTRTRKITNALAQLNRPLDEPLGSEYAGLVQEAEALRDVRPKTEALVRDILEHQSEIEAILASTVENYTSSRLDAVDTCILHLGLYELLFAQLPVPIVVSEMTALANAFSGVKSARFIHGIVGAVAAQRS